VSVTNVGGFGVPIFLREVLAHARRTRTYVFQTIFLSVMVLCLIPFWPASTETSGAAIADTGRMIFEYGGYLQIGLLLLLAPAVTANAIVEEKERNTLDLLLLTSAGPFAIVWGKFFSRLFNLSFLLFLTVPILFALLTLGGIGGTSIFIEFTILVAFAVLAAGLGVFLSTIFPKTTAALMAGYVILGSLLAAPAVLKWAGIIQVKVGAEAPIAAHVSAFYDLMYLFHPSRFVSTESFPESWWICPLWNAGLGLVLVLVAGLLLPHARSLERLLSTRKLMDAFDRATYYLIRFRFRALLGMFTGGGGEETTGEEAKALNPEHRRVGTENPIYWKETCVNTIGRNRYWWRVNFTLLVLLLGSYLLFSQLMAPPELPANATAQQIAAAEQAAATSGLNDIEFHRYYVAVLTGILVLLSTIIAATTVSQEREDGTLTILASTPLECATYVKGKVRGVSRNIVFLVALPFLHVGIWILAGVIHPVTFLYLLISIPLAVVAQVTQGILVSLLFPTTLRAIMGALILIIIQAALPLVCCLPTFNLPLTSYFMVEPTAGLGSIQQMAGTQANYLTAMLLALFFSAGTQLGYVVVVYSLIRSGFDRYIGRAG
jgi:ABC-type transport system involved in multi-copper enzyme maturation permease subunit